MEVLRVLKYPEIHDVIMWKTESDFFFCPDPNEE